MAALPTPTQIEKLVSNGGLLGRAVVRLQRDVIRNPVDRIPDDQKVSTIVTSGCHLIRNVLLFKRIPY